MSKMEDVVRRLVGLVAAPAGGEAQDVRVDVGAAPPVVRDLVAALAGGPRYVDLGEYSIDAGGLGGVVQSLAWLVEHACAEARFDLAPILALGGPGGVPFDPTQSVLLGPDAGGTSHLGVSWSGGVLGFVVVEVESPSRDSLLHHFRTPEAFFAFLDHANRRVKGSLPHVDALRAITAP